ncbi:MAG: hypothetical protein WCG05_04940 [Alphaproteobacteria bacterium]
MSKKIRLLILLMMPIYLGMPAESFSASAGHASPTGFDEKTEGFIRKFMKNSADETSIRQALQICQLVLEKRAGQLIDRESLVANIAEVPAETRVFITSLAVLFIPPTTSDNILAYSPSSLIYAISQLKEDKRMSILKKAEEEIRIIEQKDKKPLAAAHRASVIDEAAKEM